MLSVLGKPFFQRPFMMSRLRGGQLLSTIASSSMMYNKVGAVRCAPFDGPQWDLSSSHPYPPSTQRAILAGRVQIGTAGHEPCPPTPAHTFQVVSKLGLLDTSRTAWESDDHDAVRALVQFIPSWFKLGTLTIHTNSHHHDPSVKYEHIR